MRRAALAAASFLLSATAAASETGEGCYPHSPELRLGVKLAPLKALGADALRVKTTPAIGRVGWIVELRRLPSGAAAGRLVVLRHTGRLEWTPSQARRLRLSPERWSYLAGRVDAELARPQLRFDNPGEARVCADGGGRVVERRRSGRDAWMSEACTDIDPTDTLVPVVGEVAGAPPLR